MQNTPKKPSVLLFHSGRPVSLGICINLIDYVATCVGVFW